jgi:hypothetical protein
MVRVVAGSCCSLMNEEDANMESRRTNAWSFGDFSYFAFDKSLRLELTDTCEPPKAARHEKPVETLLLFNLDRLLEHWNLEPASRHVGAWAGADMIAIDPCHRVHVFEIKQQAKDRRYAIDQVLAYALQQVGAEYESMKIHPQAHAYLSRRLAVFWDEHAGNASGAAAIEESHIARADEFINRLHGFRKLNATGGVHLHVVLPEAEHLDLEEVTILNRLRRLGVQASVWEARLKLNGNQTGLLAWRSVWQLPYHEKKKANPGERPAVMVSEVVAALSSWAEQRSGVSGWQLESECRAQFQLGTGSGPHLVLKTDAHTVRLELHAELSSVAPNARTARKAFIKAWKEHASSLFQARVSQQGAQAYLEFDVSELGADTVAAMRNAVAAATIAVSEHAAECRFDLTPPAM